jgi:hypothetical protein
MGIYMSKLLKRILPQLAFNAFFGATLTLMPAWVRPQLQTQARAVASGGQRLDYFVIKVNRQPIFLREGAELTVMRGDLLEVVEAKLVTQAIPVGQVDVIGFKSPSKHLGDDRGFEFRTNQLSPWYSEGRKGEVWSILAMTGDSLHGAAFLRLVDPAFRYAEVKVNGKTQVLRDGQELIVKASDQFKLTRVVTNLSDDKDVQFHIVPMSKPGHYEIRIERDKRAFAAIPLKVME